MEETRKILAELIFEYKGKIRDCLMMVLTIYDKVDMKEETRGYVDSLMKFHSIKGIDEWEAKEIFKEVKRLEKLPMYHINYLVKEYKKEGIYVLGKYSIKSVPEEFVKNRANHFQTGTDIY